MNPPSEAESLFTPRNFAAFLLVSLIWGGTWLVIRDQIASVPASWSISYRFMIAASAMFVLAAMRREPLRLVAGGLRWALLLGLFQFTLNFGFVYNAESYITSGLVAVMFALLVVLIGYASTTPGFAEGVGFLFAFDFSKLSGEAVIVALGQAFFTLSLGMAIMMAYGSYLGRDVSIGRPAVSVAIMDTVVALLAGLAIFPVVFANGLEAGAGPGLIFQTLPLAFGNMPMGGLFGTLFFILLLFAAWTSGISLLEPVVEWVEEKTSLARTGSSILVGVLCWALGIASILSLNVWADVAPLAMFERFEGKTIFDLLDFFTANVLLPLSGLLTAVFVGWFVAKESLKSDLALQGGAFTLWYNLIRFVTPIAVAIVFVYNLMS